MKRNLKWIIALTGAIIIVLLLRGFAFTSCLIPSAGMENSLFRGERILVNKWSYGLRLPVMSLLSYHRWGERKIRKEDIVVFNNPAAVTEPVIDKREVFISRCIGVPGDTLLVDSIFPSYRPEVPPPPTGKGCMSIHEKRTTAGFSPIHLIHHSE